MKIYYKELTANNTNQNFGTKIISRQISPLLTHNTHNSDACKNISQNHSAANNNNHSSNTKVTSKQSDFEQAFQSGHEAEPLKAFPFPEAIPPTFTHAKMPQIIGKLSIKISRFDPFLFHPT